MSDTLLATPQQSDPESVMTLVEVLAAIDLYKTKLSRLRCRLNELQSDKRKIPDPIRNLKISANRSYQWSKRGGFSDEDARKRTIAAVWKKAAETTKGPDANDIRVKRLAEIIEETGALPAEVTKYIEQKFLEYDIKPRPRSKRKKHVEIIEETQSIQPAA